MKEIYNIMVVDDQPANLKLLEEILGKQGYRVRSFPRGRLALAAAIQHPPDLILLDINMPEMNGFEVCTRFKSNPMLASIPVIFLSALTEIEEKLTAFRSGGADYVTKPFQVEEVQARVETHVRIHRLQEALRMHNEHLEELVRHRTRELEKSRLEILHRLAMAAEYRHDSTGRHIHRVGRVAGLLAQELGMSDTEVRLIGLAAPLHDVGKIGLPDRILLKPGDLIDEEFQVVQTHVVIGANILSGSDSPILQMAEAIARYHHERWDGSGYVAGLAGEQIPIAARIVAVADALDALTHERSYKRIWPIQQAMEEIWSQAGSRYDPKVVTVLHKVVASGQLVFEDKFSLAPVMPTGAVQSRFGSEVEGRSHGI